MSLRVQRQLLIRIQGELVRARTRLVLLRGDLARDRQIRPRSSVSQYESPPPNVVASF